MRRKRDAAGEGGRSGRNSGLENLDSRDNAQLLEELDSYLERTDMFSLDLERVDAYLAKMQEREPVGEDYDQPAELERLFAAVEAEEAAQAAERKPRRAHRLRRVWWKVAVAAVLVFAVAASTFGSNPIKALLERVEVFFVGTSRSGQLELPPDSVSEFKSMQQALAAYGIDERLCPQWIPSDFYMEDIRIRESDYTVRLIGYYNSETRGSLRIQISDKEIDTAMNYEKEEGGYSYIKGNTEYYILFNTDNAKASWQVGPYNCIISGQVTEKELEKMIDSITEKEP